MRRWAGLLLLVAMLAACGGSEAGSSERAVVRVAAAADLKFALDEIVRIAEREQPDLDVEVTYGSSGMFLQQIVNGAPYDLYLSADLAFPQQLVDQGLAGPDDLFGYAVGHLVVWTPEGSPVDPAAGLPVLADDRIRRVAIANPEVAPYGRAAQAALRSAGLDDVVGPKLVLGENVAQAAEFVQSGNADAGVVALSLVLSDPLRGVGRWVEVPPEAFPLLKQAGVVLSGSPEAAAAREVRGVLLGPAGRAVLDRYGFVLPEQ